MDGLSEDEIVRTIEVLGLPDDVDLDDVYGYFENFRIGGGEVEKLQTNTGCSTFLTFKDRGVVDAFIEKQKEKPIRVAGIAVQLRLCEKPKPVPVIGREVVVSGIPEDWDEADWLTVLENKRKGGGLIEAVVPRDASGVAVVTFVDQQVAERLVEKTALSFTGVELSLSWPMRLPSGGGVPKTEICPRTIHILDFPEELLENLTLHLESKRFGGGKLDSVVTLNDGTAAATFVEEKVATKFLERESIKINKKQYTVTKPSSSSTKHSKNPAAECPNTIEVSGIPTNTSEEYLKMYFENKKRSGGGDVRALSYNAQEGTATVTFDDPTAVKRILEKGEHKFGAETIQVLALESLTPDLIDQVCAIRVSDIPTGMSQDLLEYYFESEKRSGGAEFDEFIYDKDSGSATIVFKNPEVCRKVVSRPHQLDSVRLSVEALKPPPPPPLVVGKTDEKKLLVGDLPNDFEDKDLKVFLEKSGGCAVARFIRGSFQDMVLVEFKNIPNYNALRKLMVSKPFQGQMISVQKVKPSSSIIVHDAQSLSDDVITLYFENSNRSGGGEVQTIKRDSNGDVIVEFVDRNVIPEVLKKMHKIGANQLKTELYHECLSEVGGINGRRKKIRIPEGVTASVDTKILQFLSKFQSVKTTIDADMQQHYCDIQWTNPEAGSLKLVCTLRPGLKNLEKIAMKWESVCSEQLNMLLEKIVIREEKVSSEIWDDFIKEVKSVKKGDLSVDVFRNEYLLRVVGVDNSVQAYLKSIGEIRNKFMDQLAKRKSKIFKSLKTLKPIQLQLLRTLKFPQGQTGISKDIDVNVSDTEVSFQGSEEEIAQVMIRVYELANKMITLQAANFDANKIRFLQKKEVVEYFAELFNSKHLKVAWSISSKCLELIGLSDSELKEALSLLESEIVCKVITLDTNQLPTVKQEKWNEFRKGMQEVFQVSEIKTDVLNSTISVVSIREAIEQIVDEVHNFLDQHTIVEQFIPLESGKVAYIEQFMAHDVKSLQQKLSQEQVTLELMQTKKSSGIVVQGTKTGFTAAMEGLSELYQQIQCTTHESDIYGVLKYFSTSRGRESVDKIQSKKKVIVEISKQLKNSGARGSKTGQKVDHGPILKSSVLMKESRVKVQKGNLTECQVKAIVVPIRGDLKYSEGAGKLIHEAGGSKVEEECQTHIKVHGKLLPGHIYISGPGNLPCSAIIHMATPLYVDGKKKEADYLEEGIWAALGEMKKNQWRSIAISGSTGFPPAVGAKIIIDSVNDFLEKEGNVQYEINLIHASDQVVNHFHEAVVSKFGKDAVQIGGTKDAKNLALPLVQRIVTRYQQGKDAVTVITPEGVQVALIPGTIATQQVDVIVNTASKELILTQGAVSNSLQQAAGPNLQAECKSKAPNGVSEGNMLSTAGHSLQCKQVYHAVCGRWDAGKGAAEQVMRSLLKKIFLTAHQTQMSSIAIPALGSGNLGYPRETVSAIMYEEAEIFSRDNPKTTLKDIRFVVFDQETVDAFQAHLKKLLDPSGTPIAATPGDKKTMKSRQLKHRNSLQPGASALSPERSTADEEQDILDPDGDVSLDINMKTVKIKSLTMEITQGDITRENTDAIVNSTNKDLNLVGGAVTKAIIDAGGKSIAAECRKLGHTDKHGVAVTGAGKLKCKYIFHLATPETSLDKEPEAKLWEERIANCLKEAEKMSLKSITFPLLGTGKWNTSPAEMAVNILNGIGQFVGAKPKNLKTIRICIFQPKMVDEFFTAITKKLSEKKTTSFWGRFTGWLSSFASPDAGADSEGSEMISDTPKTLHDYQSIFRIYGLSQTVIDEVIVELERLVKEAVTDKVIDSPDLQESIAKLTPEQIRDLESDAASHQVRASVEQGRKLNRIRLQGDANDIADVLLNITKILREVDLQALKKQEAKRIAEQAHWEFKEVDGSYEPYPTEINAIIETAFRSKAGFAEWEENDGKFRIDFKANTEENLTTKAKGAVRRIGDAPIEEPKNWEPMNPGEGCRLVHIPVGSNEYTDVEARIKATCQNSCKEILKIERIQNRNLYQQFAVWKQNMEATAGAGAAAGAAAAGAAAAGATTVERTLWHGTSSDTVSKINENGFNRSYCGKNATAYGKGVYFARDWSYSAHAQYSPPNPQGFKYVYQTRVLTGEFTTGNPNFVEAPPKPNQTVQLYDSVVDNVANPILFVIFKDAQAYPEYLITFIV